MKNLFAFSLHYLHYYAPPVSKLWQNTFNLLEVGLFRFSVYKLLLKLTSSWLVFFMAAFYSCYECTQVPDSYVTSGDISTF